MDTGAVVLMDALGFRGIWKRHSAQEILSLLQSLRAATTASLAAATSQINALEEKPNAQHKLQVAFLSDTVVIAAVSSAADGVPDLAASVLLAAHATSNVLRVASSGQPPMIYRGAVAAGQFSLDDPFIVGPAVDDAAENMEVADAAVVWLSPSALLQSAVLEGRTSCLFREEVPLKTGARYSTLVINPLAYCDSDEHAEHVIGRIKAPMEQSNALSVQVKLQNTARILEVAASAAAGKYYKAPAKV